MLLGRRKGFYTSGEISAYLYETMRKVRTGKEAMAERFVVGNSL